MLHRHFVLFIFVLVYLITHHFKTPPGIEKSDFVPVTACVQFAHFNTIPLSFFSTHSRSRLISCDNIFLSLTILLCGDVQPNPGPTCLTFNICTLNIRSLTNPTHYSALSSYAVDHHVHLFALTETWITPHTTSAELLDSIPRGFSLLSFPRHTCSTAKVVGGGTAFLVH